MPWMLPDGAMAATRSKDRACFRLEDPNTMDILNDARRLATIGTFFIILGWIAVIYALIAGLAWWIDLASRDGVQHLRGLRDLRYGHRPADLRRLHPRGLGYALRLFALYVVARTNP